MRFSGTSIALLLAFLCSHVESINGNENGQESDINSEESSGNDGTANHAEEEGPFQIADRIPVRISSIENDSDIAPVTVPGGGQQYTISNSGSSYISVHFANLDLDPECSMEIADQNGDQSTIMHGRGRENLGTFWAHHVEGDTIIMILRCNGSNLRADFVVDEYAAGYPDGHPATEERKRGLRGGEIPFTHLPRDLSICSADDKRNAKCYQSSHPTEYNKAKAVARLIINGSGGCTGWLVGPNNLLLTNWHCIESNLDAMNTDYQFMFEGDTCDSNSVGNMETFDAIGLLKDNASKDYALVQLDGNPVATYGYLDIEDRVPSTGEKIFIPQHAGARDKEIGIYDTSLDGSNNRCEVKSTSTGFCRGGGAYFDVSYSCDTEGGSSGSPVLSVETGKVIALHHCGGGCSAGNKGVPMTEIYHEISSFVYDSDSPPTPPPNPPIPTPTSAPNSPPTDQRGSCNNDFVLELTTDNYGGETSWDVKKPSGEIKLQGSGYQDDKDYRIEGCLDDGEHVFTIRDYHGDGICCGFGNGSYTVKYNGNAVKSGGTFGDFESITVGAS